MINKQRLLAYFTLGAVSIAAISFYFLNTSTIDQTKGYVYYLPPGSSKHSFVADLSKRGMIKSSLVFNFYIYFKSHDQLKAGEYLFPYGATPRDIWWQVTHGKGLYNRAFTIVPGWTFKQLRQELAQSEGLQHFTAPLSEGEIMNYLGAGQLNPEGEFYPETYHYTRGVQDLVILKRAFQLMQTRLIEIWAHRYADNPFKNAYELLIAASLIEKEAFLDEERPIIAGVIVNRLRKNMLLQFDPTVIYGMGSRFSGKIHKQDLTEDTVYNTYVRRGLPPTPIAMPGKASLEAAAKPQANNFYYFVAKGKGSHQFSENLQDHHQAVENAIKAAQVKQEPKEQQLLLVPQATAKP